VPNWLRINHRREVMLWRIGHCVASPTCGEWREALGLFPLTRFIPFQQQPRGAIGRNTAVGCARFSRTPLFATRARHVAPQTARD
jgi:hypothetical protein